MLEACVHPDASVSFSETDERMESYPSFLHFISVKHHGHYTCVRVSSSSPPALLLWSYHLERLRLGLQSEEKSATPPFVSALQTATARLTTNALDAWASSPAAKGREGMLSILWWRDATASGSMRVGVHVGPLPVWPATPLNVLVQGGPRANATCKHTRWTEERKPLVEAMRQCEAEETIDGKEVALHESILSTEGEGSGDRALLEGMTSNFYVVQDGGVRTADAGVLRGSTRELVLRACAALNIPVVLQAPRLAEARKWQAAFITSCSRVVHPIRHVCWRGFGEVSGLQHVTLEHGPSLQLLDAIRAWVQAHLEDQNRDDQPNASLFCRGGETAPAAVHLA